LFWGSNCLTFGVSGLNTKSLGLTAQEFEDIVADSFKVWEGVECSNGKYPGLNVQSVGVVDSNGDFFCEDEPRANLSVWSLVTRWERSGNALGYTSSTHNRKDGEVFDADVELNLNKIANDNTSPEDYAVVLGKIITHEAGHFLGLAHSVDEEAVMYASYDTFDLFTRELNQDDIDGICDLYPPDDDLKCSEPGYVEAALNQEACDEAALAEDSSEEARGCSVAPTPAGRTGSGPTWFAAMSALGVAVALRRRRA
jgi:MYXO-CTERM domain-containing protein